jgi:integral membrane protein (TIGR01906 family)
MTKLTKVLSWVIVILVPIVLTMTAARILDNLFYLRFEYNLPYFPVDQYGFTTEERIHWAEYSKDYLFNAAGIDYIADLKFPDGTPFYNLRELSHMLDAKIALQGALWVWRIALVLLIAFGFWAWYGKWWQDYLNSLRRGGWFTVILIGAIVLFSLVAFGIFFTAFHGVFFESGTWQFYYSDSLIRLFPQRFWQDIFIYVGGMSILAGLALGLGLRKKTT